MPTASRGGGRRVCSGRGLRGRIGAARSTDARARPALPVGSQGRLQCGDDRARPTGHLFADGGAAARAQDSLAAVPGSPRRSQRRPGREGRWHRRCPSRSGATELHFFPGAAEAQDAAQVVEPVVGSTDESVLNGLRALGPVLVLHYSFFIGDSPGGIGIDEDLEPPEACLRDTGYLQS